MFAETGVKDLFRKILELVGKRQQAPRILRLRNRWVAMDPRQWNTGMDLTINVGLGTGNKDQMLVHLRNLLGLQVEAIRFQGGAAGPLVTIENIYNTLARLVENAGLKSVDAYFTDPTHAPPSAPPAPALDPQMLALQQRARLDEAKLQLERERAQAEIVLDRARAEAEIALKRDGLMAEVALKREELALRAATRPAAN